MWNVDRQHSQDRHAPKHVDALETSAGPDLVIDLGDRWQVNLEYLERRDEDPYLVGRKGSDLKTRGGFAEVTPLPNMIEACE